MKPIKLVMSAFGSYAGVEEISFNCSRGLFLIAGDTGSGKSTIFDAIMFALYDTMSGKERKPAMMRSEYAADNLETFVEYTFLYHRNGKEEVYTIRRSPTYERRAKRRNKDGKYGVTRQTGKVSLIMPDGKVYNGKAAQINAKIQEIVGLTAEQFSKIAMIAQGEFQELIMDRTGKRKEIFKEIFSTEIYGRLEKAILERYKKSCVVMKENLTQIRECVEGITFEDREEELRDEWKNVSAFLDTEPEKVYTFLQKNTEMQEGKIDILRKEMKKREEEKEKALVEYREAEENNRLLQEKEILSEERKACHAMQKEMDALKEAYRLGERVKPVKEAKDVYTECQAEERELAKKEAECRKLCKEYQEEAKDKETAWKEEQAAYQQKQPGIVAKIQKVKEELTGFHDWQEAKKQYKKCKELEELEADKLKEEKVTLAKEKEKEQEICEWLEQRKELSLWWERSEQEGKRLKDVKKALETFFEGEEKLLKEQEILQQKEELCNQKIKSWEEARRRTEEKNRLYIASEAVFLAAKLREGIPCPVCGSLSHPSPASLSEEKVTEDELLACQESERTAEEEKNAAVLSVEKQRHRIALEKEQLEEKGRAILSEEGEYEGKTISEALLSYRLQKEEAYKRWQQERVSLQKQIQEKKEKEEALSVQKMVQKKREMSIEKMTECVMKLSQETKEKEAQKDLLKKQLTIVSTEEGEAKLNSLEAELSIITASLTKKEKESEKSREKYATISGKHKQMQTHMEALQQKLVNAEEKWQSLRQEYQLEEDTAYQEALVFLEGQEERKEALTAYRENRLKLDTRWDELSKRTKGKVFKGLDELQAHCQELTGLLETQKEGFEKEQYLYRRDMQAVKRLRRLLDDRGAFWEEAKVFGALNDAANGRMHFQTYIQRYYFKQIIQAANRRLAKMSNSPFLLKCRELGSSGQGEIGLDLDVLNPVTGKVRDAHTLSGGETFLASLSLALGMADVVQNTVGKIQMETMFIDEGFGSLSEDVRNTAVRVLEELAGNNRLIGIISHVTELKEQIPDKLLVEKGKQGSHVRWVRE